MPIINDPLGSYDSDNLIKDESVTPNGLEIRLSQGSFMRLAFKLETFDNNSWKELTYSKDFIFSPINTKTLIERGIEVFAYVVLKTSITTPLRATYLPDATAEDKPYLDQIKDFTEQERSDLSTYKALKSEDIHLDSNGDVKMKNSGVRAYAVKTGRLAAKALNRVGDTSLENPPQTPTHPLVLPNIGVDYSSAWFFAGVLNYKVLNSTSSSDLAQVDDEVKELFNLGSFSGNAYKNLQFKLNKFPTLKKDGGVSYLEFDKGDAVVGALAAREHRARELYKCFLFKTTEDTAGSGERTSTIMLGYNGRVEVSLERDLDNDNKEGLIEISAVGSDNGYSGTKQTFNTTSFDISDRMTLLEIFYLKNGTVTICINKTEYQTLTTNMVKETSTLDAKLNSILEVDLKARTLNLYAAFVSNKLPNEIIRSQVQDAILDNTIGTANLPANTGFNESELNGLESTAYFSARYGICINDYADKAIESTDIDENTTFSSHVAAHIGTYSRAPNPVIRFDEGKIKKDNRNVYYMIASNAKPTRSSLGATIKENGEPIIGDVIGQTLNVVFRSMPDAYGDWNWDGTPKDHVKLNPDSNLCITGDGHLWTESLPYDSNANSYTYTKVSIAPIPFFDGTVHLLELDYTNNRILLNNKQLQTTPNVNLGISVYNPDKFSSNIFGIYAMASFLHRRNDTTNTVNFSAMHDWIVDETGYALAQSILPTINIGPRGALLIDGSYGVKDINDLDVSAPGDLKSVLNQLPENEMPGKFELGVIGQPTLNRLKVMTQSDIENGLVRRLSVGRGELGRISAAGADFPSSPTFTDNELTYITARFDIRNLDPDFSGTDVTVTFLNNISFKSTYDSKYERVTISAYNGNNLIQSFGSLSNNDGKYQNSGKYMIPVMDITRSFYLELIREDQTNIVSNYFVVFNGILIGKVAFPNGINAINPSMSICSFSSTKTDMSITGLFMKTSNISYEERLNVRAYLGPTARRETSLKIGSTTSFDNNLGNYRFLAGDALPVGKTITSTFDPVANYDQTPIIKLFNGLRDDSTYRDFKNNQDSFTLTPDGIASVNRSKYKLPLEVQTRSYDPLVIEFNNGEFMKSTSVFDFKEYTGISTSTFIMEPNGDQSDVTLGTFPKLRLKNKRLFIGDSETELTTAADVTPLGTDTYLYCITMIVTPANEVSIYNYDTLIYHGLLTPAILGSLQGYIVVGCTNASQFKLSTIERIVLDDNFDRETLIRSALGELDTIELLKGVYSIPAQSPYSVGHYQFFSEHAIAFYQHRSMFGMLSAKKNDVAEPTKIKSLYNTVGGISKDVGVVKGDFLHPVTVVTDRKQQKALDISNPAGNHLNIPRINNLNQAQEIKNGLVAIMFRLPTAFTESNNPTDQRLLLSNNPLMHLELLKTSSNQVYGKLYIENVEQYIFEPSKLAYKLNVVLKDDNCKIIVNGKEITNVTYTTKTVLPGTQSGIELLHTPLETTGFLLYGYVNTFTIENESFIYDRRGSDTAPYYDIHKLRAIDVTANLSSEHQLLYDDDYFGITGMWNVSYKETLLKQSSDSKPQAKLRVYEPQIPLITGSPDTTHSVFETVRGYLPKNGTVAFRAADLTNTNFDDSINYMNWLVYPGQQDVEGSFGRKVYNSTIDGKGYVDYPNPITGSTLATNNKCYEIILSKVANRAGGQPITANNWVFAVVRKNVSSEHLNDRFIFSAIDNTFTPVKVDIPETYLQANNPEIVMKRDLLGNMTVSIGTYTLTFSLDLTAHTGVSNPVGVGVGLLYQSNKNAGDAALCSSVEITQAPLDTIQPAFETKIIPSKQDSTLVSLSADEKTITIPANTATASTDIRDFKINRPMKKVSLKGENVGVVGILISNQFYLDDKAFEESYAETNKSARILNNGIIIEQATNTPPYTTTASKFISSTGEVDNISVIGTPSNDLSTNVAGTSVLDDLVKIGIENNTITVASAGKIVEFDINDRGIDINPEGITVACSFLPRDATKDASITIGEFTGDVTEYVPKTTNINNEPFTNKFVNESCLDEICITNDGNMSWHSTPFMNQDQSLTKLGYTTPEFAERTTIVNGYLIPGNFYTSSKNIFGFVYNKNGGGPQLDQDVLDFYSNRPRSDINYNTNVITRYGSNSFLDNIGKLVLYIGDALAEPTDIVNSSTYGLVLWRGNSDYQVINLTPSQLNSIEQKGIEIIQEDRSLRIRNSDVDVSFTLPDNIPLFLVRSEGMPGGHNLRTTIRIAATESTNLVSQQQLLDNRAVTLTVVSSGNNIRGDAMQELQMNVNATDNSVTVSALRDQYSWNYIPTIYSDSTAIRRNSYNWTKPYSTTSFKGPYVGKINVRRNPAATPRSYEKLYLSFTGTPKRDLDFFQGYGYQISHLNNTGGRTTEPYLTIETASKAGVDFQGQPLAVIKLYRSHRDTTGEVVYTFTNDGRNENIGFILDFDNMTITATNEGNTGAPFDISSYFKRDLAILSTGHASYNNTVFYLQRI